MHADKKFLAFFIRVRAISAAAPGQNQNQCLIHRASELRRCDESLKRKAPRGCSSMVERQLPKLHTRVRFPSPAPGFSSPYHDIQARDPVQTARTSVLDAGQARKLLDSIRITCTVTLLDGTLVVPAA
jgi:hypothetical protein